MNLKLLGHPVYGPRDMRSLVRFTELAAEATGHALPANYPLAGRDAFRTADEPLARAVLARAKTSPRTLTKSEVALTVRELRQEIRS